MHIYGKERYGTYERIEELLKEKNLNFERLHEQTGIATSTFSKWKKDKAKPRKSTLSVVADFLDCDVKFLTCEQDYPRKGKSSKITLSVDKNELYLRKIEDLLSTTKHGFKFSHEFISEQKNVVEGTFIDNKYRYYYETLEDCGEYREIFTLKFLDGSEKTLTDKEVETFIKDTIKYIALLLK